MAMTYFLFTNFIQLIVTVMSGVVRQFISSGNILQCCNNLERPKTKKPRISTRLLVNNRATTYSPRCYPSTISAGGLNDSVRNGKRWAPPQLSP